MFKVKVGYKISFVGDNYSKPYTTTLMVEANSFGDAERKAINTIEWNSGNHSAEVIEIEYCKGEDE